MVRRALLAAAALLLAIPAAEAAIQKTREIPMRGVSGYVQFEGVPGSAEGERQGFSAITSFTQSISRPGAAAGQSRRRASAVFDEVTVTKKIDAGSTFINEAILSGRVYPRVVVHLTRVIGGQRVNYLELTMTNAMISGYSVNDSAGGGVGLETIGLTFESIHVRHVDPESEFEWNLEQAE